MITLQIIVTAIIAVILLALFKQKQKNRLSLFGFVIWFLLWLAVLLVFWQPDATTYLANTLGIGRGADLVVYAAIIIIFYILFKIFVRLNKLDSDLTRVVRSDALKKDADKR